MLGLYIHIPYCRSLCRYCDFVRNPISGGVPEAYIDAICREIRGFEAPAEVVSIFIGGGTPSLLSPASLARIMDTIARYFHLVEPEVSIEVNPDDVSPQRVRAWRDAGVNRVSLGVQHFDDAVLQYLGRRHDAAAAIAACAQVAEVFRNWSTDLIFAVNGFSTACWEATIEQCLALAPPHISTYGLTYEAGTPFGTRAGEAPEDDAALAQYQRAEEILSAYGHYEISNYALPGFACRHNLHYWHNETYAGFGAGAYSFLEGVRARNHPGTAAYLEAPGDKCEALALSDQEIRVETVIQHLRLRDGLPLAAYRDRFGVPVETHFSDALEALDKRGLIEVTAEAIRPTREGFYLNNEIGLALLD